MTDIKFSCPQCGQHISCDEPWAGRQIECPLCHGNIVVPQVQAPSEVPVATVPSRGSSKAAGARLAPGVTQVPRPTARPLAPARKSTPRPPRSENSLLKYGVLVVVVVEISMITPPVGMNVFVLKALLPDVSITTIFRGLVPFIMVDVMRLALFIAVPSIILFLPSHMK